MRSRGGGAWYPCRATAWVCPAPPRGPSRGRRIRRARSSLGAPCVRVTFDEIFVRVVDRRRLGLWFGRAGVGHREVFRARAALLFPGAFGAVARLQLFARR